MFYVKLLCAAFCFCAFAVKVGFNREDAKTQGNAREHQEIINHLLQ